MPAPKARRPDPAYFCPNCDAIMDRQARLVVMTRKLAISVHSLLRHRHQKWYQCDEPECREIQDFLQLPRNSREERL